MAELTQQLADAAAAVREAYASMVCVISEMQDTDITHLVGADSAGGSIRLDEFGEYLGGFLPVVDLTGSVVDFGSYCGEIVRV